MSAGTELAPLLRVRGLEKRFGSRVALAGLDLAVGRGEIFGLLGPNGAGKTTAFRVLTGLLPADGGSVIFDGAPLDPASRAFRRRIGVIFQEPSLDAKLTARENLHMGAALYGLSTEEQASHVPKALAFAGVQERGHEQVARFSGGMRRRLELARVLMHDPQLLFLDEPGQGVDPHALARLWDELARLKRDRGLSAVVTTHQPYEAERCDRLAILDEGRVVAAGTPDELRGQVAGNVLHVLGTDPKAIVEKVRLVLGRPGTVLGDLAVIETGGEGVLPRLAPHEMVPRVAELFAPGELESIAVRRPSLADVFAKLTGHRLDENTAYTEPS